MMKINGFVMENLKKVEKKIENHTEDMKVTASVNDHDK